MQRLTVVSITVCFCCCFFFFRFCLWIWNRRRKNIMSFSFPFWRKPKLFSSWSTMIWIWWTFKTINSSIKWRRAHSETSVSRCLSLHSNYVKWTVKMIRKVFVGAILVFHLVQSSYALPLAQQDEPRPNPMQEPTGARQFPPMLPIPVPLPTESRQEQPMMPMSVPMPNQPRQEQPMSDGSMHVPMPNQDQNEPMPMHNDPMMMIAMRNPAHARNVSV